MKFKMALTIGILFCLFGIAHTSGVIAAPTTTISVNTTADELNNDGDCSLREAVKAANTNAAVDACPAGTANDTIELPSGTTTATVYTLSLTGSADDNGDLDLKTNITLRGINKQRAVIEGNTGWADRIVDITGSSVTLDHLTIRKGNFGHAGDGAGVRINAGATATIEDSVITLNTNKNLGAGIFNQGTLVVLDSTISENSIANDGSDAHGGGLYNDGVATLTNAKFQNNTTATDTGAFALGGNIFNSGTLTLDAVTVQGGTAFAGGGIFSKGELTMVNSTVNGNNATNGGGIYSKSAALVITNSTMSGNTGGTGGALYHENGLDGVLSNVTVSQNQASNQAAGIFRGTGGSLRVKNSIIAGNISPSNPDCFGIVSSDGNNLLGARGNTCTSFSHGANGDLVGTLNAPLDAKLNALANNGGKTQTHALQAGSPAMDAGNISGCTDADGNALATDQRGSGFARTLDGFGSGTPRCDMGAYEAPANSAHTATPTFTHTPTITKTPTSTVTPVVITASGVVWNDLDFDGIRESGEPFIQNVTVEMRSGDKTQIYETDVTDANGQYAVHGPPGSLTVHVILPNGFSFSPQNQGNDHLADSDIAAIGEHLGYSNLIFQTAGGIRIDAGMYDGATPTATRTNTPSLGASPTPTATPTATPTNGCATKPPKPTLKKPNNNSTVSSTQPKLTWSEAACANTYKVTVKDAATNKKVDSKTGLTVLKYKTKTLAANTTFKWFVQACNAFGCTKSAARTFSTP